MKKIAMLSLLLVFLITCSKDQVSIEEICRDRDTVKVLMRVRNVFYIEVKSLMNGQGIGENVVDSNRADTMYFIKYPTDTSYSLMLDEDRQKIKKLVL